MSQSEKKGFAEALADSLSRSDVLEIVLKNTIVAALITARMERSMNQKEFAAFMSVSQAMVSKWEGGDCNFTIETIAKICEKLGLVPTLELIKENDYLSINEENTTCWNNGLESKPVEPSEELSYAA
jgi:transcriptional regulator with XRE-family HTH domain